MKKLKLLLILSSFMALLVPVTLTQNVYAGPAEDCEAAGGSYSLRQNPSTGEYDSGVCECPDGNTYYEGACLSRSDLRAALCQDSGGTPRFSSPNGFPEYSTCECPDDEVLRGSTCEPPSGDTFRSNDGHEKLAADCEAGSDQALTSGNCEIIRYLVLAINILSGLAGLAIVASIVIAGYQYMTARDNAGQIQKAKLRITWALSALFIFIFMYALLNFLVPGGII